MRTALTCIAYTLAVLAVAVGIDRVVSHAVYGREPGFEPAVGAYYHSSVAEKLDQVANGAMDGRNALFIGNSLTMLGVDPRSFDAAAGRGGHEVSSYNLSLPSVGVTFWPEFFERYWRERIPQDLLLGVQPRDVNPRGVVLTAEISGKFFEEEEQSGSNEIERLSEGALSDAFVLWQRRGTLFSHAEHPPIGDGPGSTDIHVVDDQGFCVTGVPFVLPAAELRSKRREIAGSVAGPPFALAPEAEQALDALAAQQAERGGKLILFTFPIYFDSEPEGAPGVRADFVRAMRRFAATHANVRFVDSAALTRSEFSAGDYVDENHFNPPAARRFSADLAELVGPSLSP